MKSFLSLGLYTIFGLAAAEPLPTAEPEAAELESRQFFNPLIPLLGLGIIAGALGSSSNPSTPACRCSIPKCDGANACECINNAAVACWVQQRGECQLSLNACRSDPNAPPTDPRSQFPPCLPSGTQNPSFGPCAADRKCQKVDNACEEWRFRSQGGCIGICIPRSLGQQTSSPKNPYSPKSGGSGQPKQSGGQGQNPWQQAQPPQPQYQQPQPQPQSQPRPAPQQQGGPPNYGSCPTNVRCPGNNVCTPDPRNKNTFLCIQPTEICGTFQNIQCQGGRVCIADPRIQCAGAGCSGLCI